MGLKMGVGPAMVVAVGVMATAQAAARTPDLMGRWTTPGGDTVEFVACAAQVADTAACGRIVAIRDAAGRTRGDANNPEASLRNRPILGLGIVRGLRESAPGIWTGGALYNPDDGHTYRGAIHMRGRDTLELKGCALVVICQAQTWRRSPP